MLQNIWDNSILFPFFIAAIKYSMEIVETHLHENEGKAVGAFGHVLMQITLLRCKPRTKSKLNTQF